jgi:hypothetical protein
MGRRAIKWKAGVVMHYEHDIKITSINKILGYMDGTIDTHSWTAVISDKESSEAIDPATLKPGRGRIMKLSIFSDESDVEGNPFIPAITVKRHIFINYDRGWELFNRKYSDMVCELVGYISARISIRSVDADDHL